MYRPLPYLLVIKLLKRDGWYLVKVNGSHAQFKHPVKPGKVTVCLNHKGHDVPIDTLKSIEKQSGVCLRDIPAKKHR